MSLVGFLKITKVTQPINSIDAWMKFLRLDRNKILVKPAGLSPLLYFLIFLDTLQCLNILAQTTFPRIYLSYIFRKKKCNFAFIYTWFSSLNCLLSRLLFCKAFIKNIKSKTRKFNSRYSRSHILNTLYICIKA